MKKQISQAEARRMRKQIKLLEESLRFIRNQWFDDKPSGAKQITTIAAGETQRVAIKTAKVLGFATVCKLDYRDNLAVLAVYAVPNQ